jgi:hypothetical protein
MHCNNYLVDCACQLGRLFYITLFFNKCLETEMIFLGRNDMRSVQVLRSSLYAYHRLLPTLKWAAACCGFAWQPVHLGSNHLADHALFKMVRYVFLRPLRPELDGHDLA